MTSKATEPLMGDQEFFAYLSGHLDWDGDLGRDTYLVEDVGLDSLRILEILLLVEDLGVEIRDDDVPGWRTFGDTYESYRQAAAMPASR